MLATYLSLAECSQEERALASRCLSLIRSFFKDGVPLAHLAHQDRLPFHTIHRWARCYQQFGLFRLILPRRFERIMTSDLQHGIEA